jgi:hypothetical protein
MCYKNKAKTYSEINKKDLCVFHTTKYLFLPLCKECLNKILLKSKELKREAFNSYIDQIIDDHICRKLRIPIKDIKRIKEKKNENFKRN